MLQNDIKPQRIEYIDAIRAVACFTIVLLHVSAFNTYNVDFGTREWNVFMAYESIVNWAVPVFVMLSGSLMLGRDCDYVKIKRKLIRLAIIFFSWSLVYIIIGMIMNGNNAYSLASLLSQFLQGHYHMWFLIMFAGLYLITPLLRQITKDNKSAETFVVLALIFGCLVPSLNDLYQMYSNAGDVLGISLLYQAALNIKEDFKFYFVLGYSLYFVLGHILIIRINLRRTRLLTGILIFLAGATLMYAEIRCSGSKEIALTLIKYYHVGILLQSVGVVICAKALENTRLINKLSSLATCSLGIYMVHPMILEILQKYGIHSMTFDPIWFTPTLAVAGFTISAVISRIMLATPLKRMILL